MKPQRPNWRTCWDKIYPRRIYVQRFPIRCVARCASNGCQRRRSSRRSRVLPPCVCVYLCVWTIQCEDGNIFEHHLVSGVKIWRSSLMITTPASPHSLGPQPSPTLPPTLTQLTRSRSRMGSHAGSDASAGDLGTNCGDESLMVSAAQQQALQMSPGDGHVVVSSLLEPLEFMALARQAHTDSSDGGTTPRLEDDA